MSFQPEMAHAEASKRAADIEFRKGGWLPYCERVGLFQLVTRELVHSLRRELRSLGASNVLEVAAGDGTLAAALSDDRLSVLPTDIGTGRPAPQALAEHRPKVVLSCFAPFDAGIDEAVLSCRSVEHYVVINARCAGRFGSAALWSAAGWSRSHRETVSRWLLTRYDASLDARGEKWVRHGEAWLFSRKET